MVLKKESRETTGENRYIMFSILRKKEKIIVDAYTFDTMVYQSTPITKSSKCIPEWWKKLPNYGIGNAIENTANGLVKSNMRKCYGFNRLYKKGFIARNSADILLRLHDNALNIIGLGGVNIYSHEESQHGGAFSKFRHIKISLPWLIREKSGVEFIFVGCEYNLNDYIIKVMPGVMSLQIPMEMNINIMIPAPPPDTPVDIHIPIGLPLYQFVPLSEKDAEIQCHLVGKDEYEKHLQKKFVFGRFDTLVKLVKESKCPFH